MNNKMKDYLKDEYSDNPIINFLNYWMKPSNPREKNDLDCLYFNGDLNADTIFSVWTPLKFVLDCLNPNEKFYKVDKYSSDPHSFLKKIRDNIDEYLPKDKEIVQELYAFVKLAETRANYMLLPSQAQDINVQRYKRFYDQMPPTLYNCFPGGIFSHYYDSSISLNEWIKRESLEVFFSNGNIESKSNIKPLISNMKVSEHRWLKNEDEISEMLCNMKNILNERLKLYS